MKTRHRQELENLNEPKPPKGKFHCKQHLRLEPLPHTHAHFQEDHGGVEANCLRQKCKGSKCKVCLANLKASLISPYKGATAEATPLKKAPTKPDSSETEEEPESSEDLQLSAVAKD